MDSARRLKVRVSAQWVEVRGAIHSLRLLGLTHFLLAHLLPSAAAGSPVAFRCRCHHHCCRRCRCTAGAWTA